MIIKVGNIKMITQINEMNFEVVKMKKGVARSNNKQVTQEIDIQLQDEVSNSLLQSIIDNTNSVIYFKDLQGKYVLINVQYETLFDISKEDVIGKTDYDIFPQDIAIKLNENDQLVLESKKSITLEETVRFNKQESFYITNKFPVFNGQNELLGVCGISTDITEIIMAKKKIEESEHDFSTLVSNVQGVVYRCSTSSDWKMHFISDYIYELSGYPSSDFIMNQKRSFASIVHSDDRKMVENKVYKGLEEKKAYLISYRIIHRDGSIRWVHEKGIGYYDDCGEVAKFLDGVIIDITAEKKLEEMLEVKNFELNKVNVELEVRIEERTLHLKQANEQLLDTIKRLEETQMQLIESRKMIAIGSLVKGICHEISTPLGGSLTMSTFINSEIIKFTKGISKSNVTQKNLVDFLMKISDFMQTNTNYIKKSIGITDDLRRISDNQIEHQMMTFDLRAYLETILAGMINDYSKKNIEIILKSRDVLMVNSFPGLIHQIIVLLMVNSEAHGFENREGGRIEISVKETRTNFVIEFSDNGNGINLKEISKIYDPFYTTKMGQFSGLGLFMVHTIVTQQLSGTIKCLSNLGEGVTFKITIPKN